MRPRTMDQSVCLQTLRGKLIIFFTNHEILEKPMAEQKDMLEREVLSEFLQLFKELPCLWDPNHTLYTNKEARMRAYQLLLEKYKMIYHDADIVTVKKKIENMRTSYRRERKKIVKDLLKHGRDRKPSLWYYNHLTFLDDIMESFGNIEMDEEEEDNDTKPQMEVNVSSVFLTENHQNPEEDVDMLTRDSYVIKETPATRMENMTETTAFGTALGLQLTELQPKQKYIAEKLISEIIYYGRFEKLTVDTKLDNIKI